MLQSHRQEMHRGRLHLPYILLGVHFNTGGLQGWQQGGDQTGTQAENSYHVHDRHSAVAPPASHKLQVATSTLPRDW